MVFGVVSMRFGEIFGRFGVWGGLGCFHGPESASSLGFWSTRTLANSYFYPYLLAPSLLKVTSPHGINRMK